MNIIGIDLGTSATKIVECDYMGNLLNKMYLIEKSFHNALHKFISTYNIDINNIEKIILTGVGASKIKETHIDNIEIIEINEFTGIATAGLHLSKKTKSFIISIGTGTSFVRVDGTNIQHIGGTGLGGGALINLCSKFLNTDSFDDIKKLSLDGNLSNVDLTIGDITEKEIKTLPKDTTASNFAKLSKNATDSDIALGIINFIFESIGMMAFFASRNDSIKDFVVVGGLTKIPHIKTVFEKIENLCGINFIIPENAEYATATGIIQNYINSRQNII